MPAYINQARRICTSVAHTLPSERRLYLGKLEVMGRKRLPEVLNTLIPTNTV